MNEGNLTSPDGAIDMKIVFVETFQFEGSKYAIACDAKEAHKAKPQTFVLKVATNDEPLSMDDDAKLERLLAFLRDRDTRH